LKYLQMRIENALARFKIPSIVAPERAYYDRQTDSTLERKERFNKDAELIGQGIILLAGATTLITGLDDLPLIDAITLTGEILVGATTALIAKFNQNNIQFVQESRE
ncbi:MAG: hypothetical protein WEC80_02260, partial [Patescibacteria group bacterium]